MPSEENKAIVRRFWEEVLGRGNLDVADEIISPSYVFHDTDVRGPEGVKDSVRAYRQAYSSLDFIIEDQIAAERDQVVTRYAVSGVPQDANEQATYKGVNISRVSDGRIEESWGNPDILGLLIQVKEQLPSEWAEDPFVETVGRRLW